MRYQSLHARAAQRQTRAPIYLENIQRQRATAAENIRRMSVQVAWDGFKAERIALAQHQYNAARTRMLDAIASGSLAPVKRSLWRRLVAMFKRWVNRR